jgi:glycosyltransferase involved in cell wall biosynthesis
MAAPDVLHVVWSGDLGGTERHVSWLVRTAAEAEATHHACFLKPGAIASELTSEGRATVIHVRSGWDALGFLRFGRMLRRSRPAVIHFHTRNLAAHLTALVAHPSARRVYTEYAPGALGREVRFRLFYFLFKRCLSAFVAIAPAMAECIVGYGVPRKKIAVVPHAVRIPIRRQADLSKSVGWRIGVVGRLERQKRVDLLLRIVVALRSRGHDASAVVVGAGSERGRLDCLANELDLARLVDFVGAQADVTPWLDGMDAFVMTSESEPLGLAALEAMARGVPVVALPCPGGLTELVREGGRLASSRDVDAAADAVEEVLCDDVARLRYREAGFAAVRNRQMADVLARLDVVYRAGGPDMRAERSSA